MHCPCQHSEITQVQCLMRKYLELLEIRRFVLPNVNTGQFVRIIDLKKFIETTNSNEMYTNQLVNKKILNTFFKKFKDEHPNLMYDTTELVNDTEFFDSI